MSASVLLARWVLELPPPADCYLTNVSFGTVEPNAACREGRDGSSIALGSEGFSSYLVYTQQILSSFAASISGVMSGLFEMMTPAYAAKSCLMLFCIYVVVINIVGQPDRHRSE